MNASTARALLVALVRRLGVGGYTARLNVSVWPGLVGSAASSRLVAAYPASKGLVRTLSGVVWVLLADAVRVAIGGTSIVVALVWGAMACGMMFRRASVPFLHGRCLRRRRCGASPRREYPERGDFA